MSPLPHLTAQAANPAILVPSPSRSRAEQLGGTVRHQILIEGPGHEVRVRPKGEEVALEIRFDDLNEALALAARIQSGSGD